MARAFPGDPPGLFDEAVAVGRRARRRLRERRCRLTARPRPLDDHRALITMLEARKLLVDRRDCGLSQRLMADGYWEMWLTEAIEAALRPGMIAIDIGANLGYFSMLMAGLVGPHGKVHAFEPNPNMADLLSESVALNDFDQRIAVHGNALWDVNGAKVMLSVPPGEPKNAHLSAFRAGDAGIPLIARRLDSFPELLDADVIKIDAEGAEEHIWQGMAGLFARERPLTIFLEYTPIRYSAPMQFLDAIRYQCFNVAELSISRGIRPVTPEQVLAGRPDEDRMLMLTRGAKA